VGVWSGNKCAMVYPPHHHQTTPSS
jgi:hypothetical protein